MDRATVAMNRYRARTRRPRVRDRPRFLESEARLPEVSASRRILRPTILNTPSDSKAQQLQQLKKCQFYKSVWKRSVFYGSARFPGRQSFQWRFGAKFKHDVGFVSSKVLFSSIESRRDDKTDFDGFLMIAEISSRETHFAEFEIKRTNKKLKWAIVKHLNMTCS